MSTPTKRVFSSRRRAGVPAAAAAVVLPLLLGGLVFAPLHRGVAARPQTQAEQGDAQQAEYDKTVKPLLSRYCIPCHGPDKTRGGVNIADLAQIAAWQKDQDGGRKIVAQIHGREMPPQSSPQPTQAERDTMTAFLTHTLDSVGESALPKNPGRVLIHRLSRLEYNNTVRDLFGITTRPADKFPADGSGGGGFDNNADTLFVPPILMERYLLAAGQIVRDAPPAHIFFVKPSAKTTSRQAARTILEFFAARAFRRPLEAGEGNRFLALYDNAIQSGDSHENAVRFALKAVLISPSFLFRIEADRPNALTGEIFPLTDYELASRLSYFLWATLPDDELFALARQNKLHEPAVLSSQVKRMVGSPKARAFADSFAGQWLRVRDLYTSVQPDPKKYPEWTPALRDAAYQETVLLFQSVVQHDESLLTLLDSRYTFLNGDLAKHYSVANVYGAEMRRVALPDGKRGGVLTQASVLTLTSFPLRTSPVLRGKWVLEEVLGTPPPPPPPVVATLSQDDKPGKAGETFRQRLEAHRSKPECAGCHSRMDPLGFGLENYDAIGKWRQDIAGVPVDSSGTLTNGETFSGPVELKQKLMARKGDFARNLTEKMLAYALGRGLEPYDRPAVRKITTALEQNNYRSDVLLTEIVQSYPFRYRKKL